MTAKPHCGSFRIEQYGKENMRYASLLRHMPSVRFHQYRFPSGWWGRQAFRWADRYLLYPYLYHRIVRQISKRYSCFLATEPGHIPYCECPVIADADDPDFSPSYMADLNHDHVRAVVTTTEMLRSELIAQGLKKECVVIPSGADLSRVKARSKKDSERMVIGFATPSLYLRDEVKTNAFGAGLGEVSFLLDVMELVWSVEKDIELWLIGEPSRQLRERVREEGRIKLLGLIPHSQILEKYSDWDIALYPRLVDVGGRHSIKLIEFMAAGCPIVATNVSEAFLVEAAGAGVITSGTEQFAEAVVSLARTPMQRRVLGERGRQFSAAYDWRHLAERYQREVLDVFGH